MTPIEIECCVNFSHQYIYQFFCFTLSLGMDTEELEKENEGFTYKGIFERDRRRWAAADSNEDNYLTKEEFLAFLHPEETPHMRDLVVLEALEDIDKDKDKKISLEEYIGKFMLFYFLLYIYLQP